MRHLWTTVTTERTVTSDAGAPEWLDLPLEDFVVPTTPDINEIPMEYSLDPAWLIQSKWMIDEIDVGRPLMPTVEYRDPLGVTLYNRAPALSSFEEAVISREFSTVPIVLDLSWTYIWYTVPGLYTFIVRWTGSHACRESGQFSMQLTDIGSAARYE